MTRAEIIAANPIVEFVRSRGHELKPAGKNFVTSGCPVTQHKRGHRPVTIDVAKEVWHCNDCDVGGSVIDWIKHEKNVTTAEAMRELGGGRNDEKPRKKFVCAYDYTDERGKLLFQVVRLNPKDFYQRHPNGHGDWINNMRGVRRVLYRLPEVIAAQTVIVVEGEKDADNVAPLGFTATTNPFGAEKWRPEYSETLRGKDVVIIGDNDDKGRAHVPLAIQSLTGKARSIKDVPLPRGKDPSEFLATLPTKAAKRAAIEKLIADTPELPPAESGHTPASWFHERFPGLADKYGDAIHEETNKAGVVSVRDIGEDFLAACLGEKANPAAPTVFISIEGRFYSYTPDQGIFLPQPEPVLAAGISRLLLECARACSHCQVKLLEFRFRDAASLSGVFEKARGILAEPQDFFASHLTECIPCSNGMLRLKDKELLGFSPSFRRRNKLAVAFDPRAKCPVFLDTLMRPALDTDDVDLLQRWCGLALIGENLAQKIVILTGTAGGGKGTFIQILNSVIGQPNFAALRPQLLGERFEIGRFLGKTLLYGADVPENFLNQRGVSILKSLTGSDPITLEFKGSNEAPAIICRFNVIVTCNSRLTVHLEGDQDAWRRRLIIIPYAKPKPERVIVDLAERIVKQEASGVLNWMLEGLDKLRADDCQLLLSNDQQGKVDNLLLESDALTLFVQEALTQEQDSQLTVSAAYDAYVAYCNNRSWRAALTRKKFGDEIPNAVQRKYGLTVRHDIKSQSGHAQRGWVGLAGSDISNADES